MPVYIKQANNTVLTYLISEGLIFARKYVYYILQCNKKITSTSNKLPAAYQYTMTHSLKCPVFYQVIISQNQIAGYLKNNSGDRFNFYLKFV